MCRLPLCFIAALKGICLTSCRELMWYLKSYHVHFWQLLLQLTVYIDLLYQIFYLVPALCKNENMTVGWKGKPSVTQVFFWSVHCAWDSSCLTSVFNSVTQFLWMPVCWGELEILRHSSEYLFYLYLGGLAIKLYCLCFSS